VDINIDFGNVNQVLEQQEINERFRSIGRMLARLKLRINRIEVRQFSIEFFRIRLFFILANCAIKFSSLSYSTIFSY
jgi:hypothetical protein